MSGPYDSILFDFDGVLADTEPIHWSCWTETLSGLDIELPWETYRANCIGVADRNMLAFLASLAGRPIDPESLRPQYAKKKELLRSKLQTASPCSAETIAMLRSLGGYRLGLVTSSSRLEVESVLERAGVRSLFAAAVFGEDVARHKPDPEPYLLAASRLGCVKPLVVEDSAAGVESAKAAGFDYLRVASPAETAGLVQRVLLPQSR